MEKRLLLAFVLSALIFAAWSMLFPPPAPVAPPEPAPASTAPETKTAGTGQGHPEGEQPAPPITTSATVDQVLPAIAGERERTVVLHNDLMEIEVSNRGGAITAMRLLEYDDDEGATLDLVQTVAVEGRTLPLQLIDGDRVDTRLYRMEMQGERLDLVWSDGAGTSVTKSLSLGEDYRVAVSVETRGQLDGAAIGVGTGLRNLGEQERNSRLAVWGDGVILADGEMEKIKKGKVKAPMTLAPRVVGFVGLQDAYFINLIQPETPVEEVRIDRLEFTETRPGEEPTPNHVLRVVVVPDDGSFDGELLGAPKEYALLQSIGGGVERTLDFGVFGVISVFFLKALWWIYGLVGNYGVAIILLTVGIRIVLFPLMHTSTVSMRKMAKVQPRVKEIQAKYKKKKNDPQARAKMSQETMALYKEEGVNPMAGCLPVLVQLPILWALYQLFLHAIELRHAPFMLWIQDLSAKDPYYVTPILMTATMWLQQKLAPQAGDPQQQRIMRMLPLIFGIMFLQFPSGLVLYWLTNNVISIIQQEITLHLVGERRLGGVFGRRRSK
jgi:YidC/Oxa1 family membrane protein insertase